jgi:hypothetical protein
MTSEGHPSGAGAQAAKSRWRKMMSDLLLFGGFLAAWFLLQLVILPRLGFQT